MKKVYIKTLGCEKNTVDSQCMMAELENTGCTITEDFAEADYIIVNTCSFILDAKTQSIETIFEYINSRTENQKIIVTGCLSQRYAAELAKEMPEVDFFLGVNDYGRIADLVSGKDSERIHANAAQKCYEELPRKISGSTTAYIKIAEGCNNICSYCAIPMIRGRYRSRKPEDILKEAQALAAAGTKELVIIAQDVTFYGRDFKRRDMLPELLHELCRIDGLKWIRLMYCYENEITQALIDTIKNEDKIVKYIDIPIQHCSDSILKAMNRKSTGESIRSTINKLRKQIPDIVIRTTLITGFPGEHAQEFKELYSFVEEMKFDRLGVFAYSREENTAAYSMKPQVAKAVKERRRDKIMELQREISLANNQKYIGKTIEVLIEEDPQDGTYLGRASFDAEGIDNGVIVSSPIKLVPGQFIKVKVKDAFDYDLTGEYTE